ncbi:diguanylate cyclase (GGDEF) domain-containing protein [Granulicatella balaenopterae]|uniref:Diguanylate cyclase (GGDEF) domain-containing protein n=1 Tax=Granulicatella balaenopterae TaxID=137733 RepID=A0A1H9KFA2_9LACT|nr:GGDEF domain-containing protein [Granulicatella balaenopterae]SEQ97792.1 diguanylate cyclase (GGDEF) domain-containing protein [Granulicatella balaenopterae]
MEMFILSGTLGILGKLRYSFSYQMATIRFINLIRAFAMYLVFDICLGCMLFEFIETSVVSLHIILIGEFISYGLIPYLWFLYAEEILDTRKFKNGLIPKLYTALLLVYCGLVVTSFITGSIYSLDVDKNIIFGHYSVMIIRCLMALFLGTTTIFGIINLATSKSQELMKKSVRVIGFVIPIVFTWYIYLKYDIPDCIPLSIFIAIFFSFLTLEDPMSFVDELTGLYNRKKMVTLYNERKISYRKDRLNTVYYIDANDFKEINDTYGHLEGDKVLRIMAKAFKKIDEVYHTVSIRVGGDEFVILACADNLLGVDFKELIRREIQETAKEDGCDYYIATSIGSAILYGDAENSFEICLANADNAMYNDKSMIKKDSKYLAG